MFKSSIAVIFGLALLTSAQSTAQSPAAGIFVVRPAENFVRTDGAPETVTRTFTVTDPAAPYSLHLYNGGRNNQFDRITSAVITLNGHEILGPPNFKNDTAFIETEAKLSTNNTFTVELRGQPGSGITIEFVGIDNTAPQIVASVNPAPNAGGWNNTDVTVSFACSDTISVIATCPMPVVVSTETAGQVVTGTAIDNAGNNAEASVTIKLDKTPPAITSNRTPDANTYSWNNSTVTAHFGATDTLSGIQGEAVFDTTLTAEGAGQSATRTFTDLAGNSATGIIANVNIDKTAPVVVITSPADGATVSSAALTVTGTATDALSGVTTLRCNAVAANPVQSPFSCNMNLNVGSNQIVVDATDTAGNTRSVNQTVSYAAAPPPTPALPPDPASIAPPIPLTRMTTFAAATEFLYKGTNAIQTGVTTAAIEPIRAAAVRGKVMTRDGAALSGVKISILNHPEFGQTLSRTDGKFDMAVNGGGPLVVRYEKTGFLPAQRQIDISWQDFAAAPDVVLIPYDTQVTTIDFSTPPGGTLAPTQIARGSAVTDAEGARRATLLFPQGVMADMVMSNGSSSPLLQLKVRATEYTVGTTGPEAMPGGLPPNSAYTYALELSADEAVTASAAEVRFSTPLPLYVENFIGFPVGTTVPVGSYDATAGTWVPSDSGRVIKVLGVTSGFADLDVTGDNAADTGTALSALAITDPERQQLALLYSPGQSLWRARIPHFSAWDINWGIAPPDNARAPEFDPEPNEPTQCQTQQAGSIIGCQNQTLGEAVPVAGTPFGLHYESDRTPGYKAAFVIDIPLSGAQLPSTLKRIESVISVAGQVHTSSFAASPNQRITFMWDGKDVYGRTLQGGQRITVRIGYTYDAVYAKTSRFGYNGGGGITAVRSRREVTLWRTWEGGIGTWDARGVGLGGWTLTAHHTFDPIVKTLYRGDGTRQSALDVGPIITTVAGGVNSGQPGCEGFEDGLPATQAEVCPRGLAVGADGSIYIADTGLRVRRVAPNGIITTIAGTGVPGFSGDGGPATQAKLQSAYWIAIGPDGSLYISGNTNGRVRRVGLDGIITTVAGNGNSCPTTSCGDGGPATLAAFSVGAIAVGQDGSIYINTGRRLRKVDPDGIISTIAGTGGFCSSIPFGIRTDPCGDGGAATSAPINPIWLAVGSDGSIYFSDGDLNRVRRISTNGIISTIAGTGNLGFSGDGGPATQATFRGVEAIALDRGSLVVVDSGNRRIRWLRLDGAINTLAGNGEQTFSGDGGLAAQAGLENTQAYDSPLALGPDGSVYVGLPGFFGPYRVRRISVAIPGLGFDGSGLAAAPDGSELYVLALDGRHLRTLDALTGAVRVEFGYNSAGRLASVTDADGNVTTIEHDSSGRATTIVSPFGQRTALSVNADGYLSRITTPTGDAVQLAYASGGLLSAVTNPRGHNSTYEYEAASGRLVRTTDATGATRTLARTGSNKDYTVKWTTALGRVTTYRVERLSNRTQRLTTTDAAGAQTLVSLGLDGRHTATYPDGTIVNSVVGPDPRWGMQAPVVTSLTVTTPGGLVYKTTTQRAATLTSPTDLLSLHTLTNTTTTNGRVYTNAYDATTRALTSTSPAGKHTTTVLDAKGRFVREQMGNLAPIAYSYDNRGRLETATQGTGTAARVMQFMYGADGFVTSITDPANRIRRYGRDASGRVTELTSPDGAQSRFGYDANGNLTSLAPPNRPDHRFAYTENNQLSGYTAPIVGSQNTQMFASYNAERQPTRVDRPDGQASVLQYDSAGRVSLIDIALGDIRYGYDSAGRLATLDRDQGSNLRFSYDGGLPLETTWSGAIAGSVARTYDNDSHLTSLNVNGADPIGLSYDADGLSVRVGALTLARNAQNGLITGSTLGSVTDTTTYDAFGVPATYTVTHGNNTIYSATFTRGALNRIATKTETVAGVTHTAAYTYDLSGRVAEVWQDGVISASYTYDTNGNRLRRTDSVSTTIGVYDAQDRLGQYGSTTYVHNAAGERESQTVSGKTTTYQYDPFGNLTGVTLPAGSQIQYVLDAEGRRVGKRVNGALMQGFLYQDFLKPIAELDGNNNVVSRFVYADGINVPTYIIRAGVTYRIVTDHLGSVRLVIDVTTGSIAQRMEYDEFGRVTLDTTPGFQPFGFAGGLYDTDTNLTLYRMRYYDPETGRWTTKDPGGFSGGQNLYAYAANDPINFIDPLGMAPLAPHIVRALEATKTPYTPAVPPPPPPAPPVRPVIPSAPIPEPLPSGGPIGPVSSYPIYQPQVPGAATGTTLFTAETGVSLGTKLACGTIAFAVGYAIGTGLDYAFDLHEKVSFGMFNFTADHALNQFIENREKRGQETSPADFYDFANQGCGRGSLTPFCTGFSSR